MMNSGFLDFAVNIPKLEHFEGVGFRRWQKEMKFLLAALNVAYVLSTPKPVEQEDETLEATRDHGQGSSQRKQGKIINLVSDSTENFIAMISEVYVMQTDDSWWVDTWATRHVCKDMNLYKSYKNLEDGPSLYMRNDSMVKCVNHLYGIHVYVT
nr:uncharacterized protein LOC109192662 [Ipomoea trifida]